MINNGPALTKDNEGYVEGIYLDSLGFPSCGFGHCLDWEQSFRSIREWHEHCFAKAYAHAEADYAALNLDLDDVRRCCITDILYNVGPAKFSKFVNTIAALRMKDYNLAAQCLEDSRWYRQVGRRGPRICRMLRSGKWEDA